MQTRVAVVTDSVACLPGELADSRGIYRLPVRLSLDGISYEDSESSLPPAAVERLRAVHGIDTTPWPPEHYARFYREIARHHADILHVVAFSRFTSTMSLAQEGARLASSQATGLRIEIVDSETTGMAQGFSALAAAGAAMSGGTLEDCRLAAGAVVASVSSIFALDSLDYIARTGRVNRLAAWAGSVLRVRPVVRLAHGQEQPLFLARSRAQAVTRIAAAVAQSCEKCATVHVAVMYSDAREDADMLLHLLKERLPLHQPIVQQFTPVTRIVAGPGVTGVAFYCDE
jgi:DegV family protein with EDD domain